MVVVCMLFGFIIGGLIGAIIVYGIMASSGDRNERHAYIEGYLLGKSEGPDKEDPEDGFKYYGTVEMPCSNETE